MVEKYLIGAIDQSLERTRQLRQIVQRRYPREYDGLRQICLTQLDETQVTLRHLAKETVVDPALQTPTLRFALSLAITKRRLSFNLSVVDLKTALQTPRRVREFKRIVRRRLPTQRY